MNNIKNKQSKTAWWLIAVIVILVAALCYTFKWDIYVRYYNLVNNHFSPGDSIYYYKMVKKEKPFDVPLWRIVTPKARKSDLKSYVVTCEWIPKDSLIKYKTDYLGIYLSHKILNVKTDDGKFNHTNFYAIDPNQKVIIKLFDKPFVNNENLPKGYQWGGTTLYLIAVDAITRN